MAAMEQVVAASKGITVVVGYVKMGADISNAAALGHDGKLIDVYEKMYLPNYGVFDEDRYFRPGTGCPVYVVNGLTVGLGIGENIWSPRGHTNVEGRAGRGWREGAGAGASTWPRYRAGASTTGGFRITIGIPKLQRER